MRSVLSLSSKHKRAVGPLNHAHHDQSSNFFLFDLILYVPSTIFQLCRDGSSCVEPVLSKDKCVLLKDHDAVTPVRLEPSVSSQALYH